MKERNPMDVTALSGLATDIQSAVNTVNNAGGGIVYVPASVGDPRCPDGKWHWNGQRVNSYGGVHIFGASPAGCIGHESNWQLYTPSTIIFNDKVGNGSSNNQVPNMFYVNGTNNKRFRISGLHVERAPPIYGAEWNVETEPLLHIYRGQNFRVDHCNLINAVGKSLNNWANPLDWSNSTGSSYGLVDHCFIDNPYKDTGGPWQASYGIDTLGNMRIPRNNFYRDLSLYAGKYGSFTNTALTYIEDCYISKARHATDGGGGGLVIARYNKIFPGKYLTQNNSIGDVCIHGGWAPNDCTTLMLEAYNNTVVGDTRTNLSFGQGAFRLRGGSGLIYNNVFQPTYANNHVFLYLESENTGADQGVYDVYYLGNQLANVSTILHNPTGATTYQRLPTLTQDGWAYVAYPYPHPQIALDDGGGVTHKLSVLANVVASVYVDGILAGLTPVEPTDYPAGGHRIDIDPLVEV